MMRLRSCAEARATSRVIAVRGLAVGRRGQRALQVGLARPGRRRGHAGDAPGGGERGPQRCRRALVADDDDGLARAGREMPGEHGFTDHRIGMPAEGLRIGQAMGLQAGQPERQDAQDHGGGDPYDPRPGCDAPADPRPQSPGCRLGRAVGGPVRPEDPAGEGHQQGRQQGDHGEHADRDADREHRPQALRRVQLRGEQRQQREDDGAGAGDDRRARAPQRLGHRRVAAVVAAQFLAVARDNKQRIIGASAEHQHIQNAGALRVDRQPGVRREEVDHRLGGYQRHPRGDHRQQPQHRASVGDQQDHDDDRQGRVQKRAVDALEYLAVVGRVPQRAGDVGGQAVRVRRGDRPDGAGGLGRAVPALLAQVDGKDGLDGLAVGCLDRARDLAAADSVDGREAPGVGGCLGPVRGSEPRGALVDDDRGEDVGRLEA